MSLIVSLSLLLQSLTVPIALALTPATASAFESNLAHSLTGRATIEPPVLAANDINDGQAELTGLAYTVNISNTSTVSHTFDIAISGQPADQVILNGVAGSTTDSVTLPAGAVSQVGLYILPSAGSVPAPGTTYPVDVTVTAADEPGLSETAPALPTVPPVPFSQLALNPTTIFVTANSTTTFAIDLANVGDAAGGVAVADLDGDGEIEIVTGMRYDDGIGVGDWLTLPLTATLTVAVPAGVDPQTRDFVVSVTNLGGGFDQAGAALTVIDALDVAISPAEQSAETGVSVDYTLTITNFMATAQAYALTGAGLAAPAPSSTRTATGAWASCWIRRRSAAGPAHRAASPYRSATWAT